eukprot:11952851-Prorocentrum_lima.AAC.1
MQPLSFLKTSMVAPNMSARPWIPTLRGTRSTLCWWCPAGGRSSRAATKQRSARQAIKFTKCFKPQRGGTLSAYQ